MDASRAERIRESFEMLAPRPNELAQRYVRRLVACGAIGRQITDVALERKSRSIGASLTLVVKNADMLGSIRSVMARGASDAFPVADPDAHDLLRRAFYDELDAAAHDAGVELKGPLASDWADVLDVVADAVFGARPEPGVGAA